MYVYGSNVGPLGLGHLGPSSLDSNKFGKRWMDVWMDVLIERWIDYDFTSFSTVFQSYQDDVLMIINSCVQRNPVYD